MDNSAFDRLFPKAVTDTFDELILLNEYEGRSRVTIAEATERMQEKGLKRADIVANNWTNVDAYYRHKGYEVERTTPDMYEHFGTYLVFVKKRT